MKKTRARLAVLAACFGLALCTVPVFAHHSFSAEYDSNKVITLTGTVTAVDWMNPHMFFHIDVKGGDGKVINWSLENGNLSTLMRRGWRKDSLKVGDVVTVEAFLAKDGTSLGNARNVKLADGKKLFSGSAGDDNTN